MSNDRMVNEMNLELKGQLLDKIPTPVMAVDLDLKVIYMNGAALELNEGSNEDVLGMACHKVWDSEHCNTAQCRMIKAIQNDEMFTARNVLQKVGKKIIIEYYCVPLKNEKGTIIGGLEFFLDITPQVQHEQRLLEQSRTIREMSTPTIKLWEGVLMLPIVGIIDSARAQYMMETMLKRVAKSYAKVVILDIHGVAAVDTAVANHLIKIVRATKLMGCNCILSGISPAVAQTIVQLGIHLDDVMTKSTLSDALEEAFTMMNMKVVSKDI